MLVRGHICICCFKYSYRKNFLSVSHLNVEATLWNPIPKIYFSNSTTRYWFTGIVLWASMLCHDADSFFIHKKSFLLLFHFCDVTVLEITNKQMLISNVLSLAFLFKLCLFELNRWCSTVFKLTFAPISLTIFKIGALIPPFCTKKGTVSIRRAHLVAYSHFTITKHHFYD